MSSRFALLGLLLLILGGCGSPGLRPGERATVAAPSSNPSAPSDSSLDSDAMEFPSVLHSAAASRFAQLKASQRRYRLDARGMPLPPGQEAPRPGPEAVRRAGPDLGETYRNDFARSYREGLSGQVFFVTHPGYFMTPSGAPFNHGSPWEYDSRVPLVFYGPGQVRSGVIEGSGAQPYDVPVVLSQAAGMSVPWGNLQDQQGAIFEPERKAVKAMLVVVMDQVGSQDLERFQQSMPNLMRMRREGMDFPDVRIHYLPTFTAVSHAGVGTGFPPAVHGIVSNMLPDDERGLRVVFRRPGGRVDPSEELVPSFADVLDLFHENKSVILTQIYAEYAATAVTGHGSSFPGGDRDIVVWHGRDGSVQTDPRWFRLPDYMKGRSTQGLVEKHQSRYHQFPVSNDSTMHQASWYAAWEAANMLEMMEKEGVGRDDVPDLVTINLKSTDSFGHSHGHDHPGYRENMAQIDSFLEKAEAYLRKSAGAGHFVIAVTSDHGLVPDDGSRLVEEKYSAWVDGHLDSVGDQDGDGGVRGFFGGQVYLDQAELAEDGNELTQVRDLLLQDPAILRAWTEKEIQESQARLDLPGF